MQVCAGTAGASRNSRGGCTKCRATTQHHLHSVHAPFVFLLHLCFELRIRCARLRIHPYCVCLRWCIGRSKWQPLPKRKQALRACRKGRLPTSTCASAVLSSSTFMELMLDAGSSSASKISAGKCIHPHFSAPNDTDVLVPAPAAAAQHYFAERDGHFSRRAARRQRNRRGRT